MTEPVEDFTQPVELDGLDSTRIRRGRAHQTLTLGPDGITLAQHDGATVTLAWRNVTGIELIQVWTAPRNSSTAKAWSIQGAGHPIYPYEFDTHWTTGSIGQWLAHYRPDLELPTDGATLPLGIPRRMYPWIILPGLLIGIVSMLFAGASPMSAVFFPVICLGGILLMVSSPRRVQIGRNTIAAIGIGCLLLYAVAWLIGTFISH